ncbi:MAG: type II secretion system protein [Candidatus Omnitrophica bacterium]|nr:type II secretion system protein [Candidatus Omnitrophota bacterium]
MKRMRRKSGFALLEVMVVAAFVSTASFTGYQIMRKADESACQNNLKQIYLSLMMNSGSLPNAVFFPSSSGDPKGINNLLSENLGGNRAVFFCPAIPSGLNKYGTSYLWNDTVSGKNLDGISGSTWLLTELTSVNPDAPTPHIGGYQTLYADGTVSVGPRINFPKVTPLAKQPAPGPVNQKPEPEVTAVPAKTPFKIRAENLPGKISVGKLKMKIVSYDELEKAVPVDKKVSIVSLNDSIQPETAILLRGVWEGEVSFLKSVQGDTILIVDEAGDIFFSAAVAVVAGPPEKIEILLPKNSLKAGESFEAEVLMQDEFGNICRIDEGKLNLECSDSAAEISQYKLQRAGTDWNERFKLVVFKAGNQKIKVTLTRNSGGEIIGEKAFMVNPGAFDHFTIEKINSPKTAGEPFKVLIHSEDRWGNLVKGPYLNDTTGTLTVSRESYISGVRMEEVRVTKAAQETFLVVEDGNNHFGKSNPFEVKPAAPDCIGLAGIPGVVLMGREYNCKVLFSDRYGNEIPGYNGELEFTSSDRNFRSPEEFLVIFNTPGKQVLTVKDKKTGITLNLVVVVIKR